LKVPSLNDASQLVREKKLSPVEITHECLRRIEHLNPKLNAFITITADSALAAARAAEAEILAGRWRGASHGIPVALKDVVDTSGVPCGFTGEGFPSGLPETAYQ
jgi:aspartyl-tRNA(Asn)/glutamyl-tRNA(Gln) amidotransferase subunit A